MLCYAVQKASVDGDRCWIPADLRMVDDGGRMEDAGLKQKSGEGKRRIDRAQRQKENNSRHPAAHRRSYHTLSHPQHRAPMYEESRYLHQDYQLTLILLRFMPWLLECDETHCICIDFLQ